MRGPNTIPIACSWLAAAALLWMPAFAAAQSDDDDDLGLDDEFALLEDEAVVELASRHKQDIGMSPSAITVITREDIEASGASTVPDLLRLVPGMDVVIVSPFFIAITSRLFWTYENNLYLVLVDGREANVDLLGQTPWAIQPILLEDIERIEIIRGPGSALYGANAFAGVVSITTRSVPEGTSARAQVTGGEASWHGAGGRVSTRIGDWGLSLSGGIDYTGRFSDPRLKGRDVWKVRGVAEYRFSDTRRLMLDAGASRGSGDLPSGVGTIRGTFDLHVLRLAYDSEDLRAMLYWQHAPVNAGVVEPLEFQGFRLAEFDRIAVDAHTIDAQAQYTIPNFYDPLMIIVGAAVRTNLLSSEQLLDGETFTDLESPRFEEPGIEYWEIRTGAFTHAEWAPADWLTVTAGLRFDYNTETSEFWSPRLAMVFRPVDGHFLRLGAARSFRKPSFLETRAHPNVTFEGSILGDQKGFRDMMSRNVGNPDLDNEELRSFELGYLGRLLDGRLNLSLDVYYSQHRNMNELSVDFVWKSAGQPDFGESSFKFEHVGMKLDIYGWELAVRWSPTRSISLLASWAHREIKVYDPEPELAGFNNNHPKNMFTLGGRFRTDWGLVGGLYVYTRSQFLERGVDNPEGILAGYLEYDQPNVALVLGRLGYRITTWGSLQMEAGVRLFLPVTLFGPSVDSPHIGYHERGGGVTPDGRAYGGDLLRRVISVYLQGSF